MSSTPAPAAPVPDTSSGDVKSAEPTGKVAVVTGGSRGIGKCIVEGLAKRPDFATVLFTATNEKAGLEALKAFKEAGLENVAFAQLEVANDESIAHFLAHLKETYPRVDVLVNNAGIALDFEATAHATDVPMLHKQFTVNTVGPLKLISALLPGMRAQNYGRIVNVSSGMGMLSPTPWSKGALGYRISKVGLNMITKTFSEENDGYNILVNSIDPGLCLTDMTPPQNRELAIAGGRTGVHGAMGAIWAATLPADGPRGSFTHDKVVEAW